MRQKRENPEYVAQKANIIKALYLIGESGFARDFEASNEKESYETLEHFMRNKLKAYGPDDADTHYVKILVNAIVLTQVLPAIRYATPFAKNGETI